MALQSLGQAYKWLWLAFTGLFAIGTGVWMVIDPDMGMQPVRPRQFTDYLTGVGAILAGAIILAFCAWVLLRKEPPEPK